MKFITKESEEFKERLKLTKTDEKEPNIEPGYVNNIEKITEDNDNFRKVLYTSDYSQLVVMSLKPKEDIGQETHGLDQFFRIEEGEGIAILDGTKYHFQSGYCIIVPAGTTHNIINTSETKPLKIYTLYSPPNHKDQTIHRTKQDAKNDHEHYDGIVTKD